MKKITLVLALALTFVVAFAMSAMAAQQLDPAATTGDGVSDYLASTGADVNATISANAAAGQTRIHSNYTANTNACAACHATHTGVGASLLQWSSVEATCMACHDGTAGVTTYNVVDGQIAATGAATNGGRFFNGAVGSQSMHNTGTATLIGDAPGGDDASKSVAGSKWGKSFECTSCHTPHGQGGNARILNPDVNDLATENKVTLAALSTTDGGTTWIAKDANTGAGVYQIQGYPYGTKTYTDAAGTASITPASITVNNGVTEIKFSAPQTAIYATYFPSIRVVMNVSNYLTSAETVTYVSGLNTFCGACHTDYDTEKVNEAQLTLPHQTTLLWADAGKTIKPMGGEGSGGVLSGTYHEAYRHQVGYIYSSASKAEPKGIKFETRTLYRDDTGAAYTAKIVACTTCHVAHGTDETVWTELAAKVSVDNGQFTGPELSARGSNLKRMPNMATCESCHAKGDGNAGMPY